MSVHVPSPPCFDGTFNRDSYCSDLAERVNDIIKALDVELGALAVDCLPRPSHTMYQIRPKWIDGKKTGSIREVALLLEIGLELGHGLNDLRLKCVLLWFEPIHTTPHYLEHSD